jgi:hypothetical protein
MVKVLLHIDGEDLCRQNWWRVELGGAELG